MGTDQNMSEKPRISTLGQRIPVETVLPEKGKSEYVHLSQELSCILYCYIAPEPRIAPDIKLKCIS